MQSYIDQIFGKDGRLAHCFDGYSPRPGQIEMAQAIDEAILCGRHLFVEAPTGTGKSLAYSVPASYHAAHNQRTVIIATANIALQEQLVGNDLPLLAQELPWRFSFSLFKGKSNYLCLDKLERRRAEGTLRICDRPDDAFQLDAIIDWSGETETGDVSELPFEPPHRLWRRFSTSSEDCKGSDCKFAVDCFASKARDAALSSNIVVCNYHLLFAHLRVKGKTGLDLVLPPFDVAILDEAHKAADIARSFFGYRVTAGAMRWAGRLLPRIGELHLLDTLITETNKFFDALKSYRQSPIYKTRLKRRDVVSFRSLHDTLGHIREVYVNVKEETNNADLRAELRRAQERCKTLREQLHDCITLADPRSVSFIDLDAKDNAVLCSKPIDVSERLQRTLFEETHSVVATSATLTTGGSFEHIVNELGTPKPRLLEVESPFDFQRQALLVIPNDMPGPNDLSFPPAVAARFAEIVDLAEGRTLGLFTSYRNMHVTYDYLRSYSYRVLKQGDMPRTALIEEFRRDVRSVLLGTESFWAGVDVPGEALSCVVIDRLPFPTPDDPVLDAISERDRRWFQNHSIPRAVIAFRQGFGRLIRTTTDRGVVVVLDHRLADKPYGRIFVNSLPDVFKSRLVENIRRFLEEAS